jgi:hypothetical protein
MYAMALENRLGPKTRRIGAIAISPGTASENQAGKTAPARSASCF